MEGVIRSKVISSAKKLAAQFQTFIDALIFYANEKNYKYVEKCIQDLKDNRN